MLVSASFKNSYQAFESYPRNLVDRGTYLPALEVHANRLNDVSSALFKERNTDADVRFRDLNPLGTRKASPMYGIRLLTHHGQDLIKRTFIAITT